MKNMGWSELREAKIINKFFICRYVADQDKFAKTPRKTFGVVLPPALPCQKKTNIARGSAKKDFFPLQDLILSNRSQTTTSTQDSLKNYFFRMPSISYSSLVDIDGFIQSQLESSR